MRSRRFVLGVAFGCSLSRVAVADEFQWTRSEQLVERAHDILVKMHPSHAEIVVERRVFNGGPRSDQATFFIDVPERAVATRLRTKAGARWYEGELLEAEAAAARYRELTGIGGYYPKDPALLSWRAQSLLALQVFPCPPGQEKAVEYTFTLPTTYRAGAYHVVLPRLGTERLEATVRATSASGKGTVRVDAKAEEGTDISLLPTEPPLLDGELVTIPVADGRIVTHYAVRAAPALGTVPKGAYVAVVVDGSRSTSEDFAEAARASIRGYLSHWADARVELFVFDRKVTRHFDRFVSVQQAEKALVGWHPTRENGSDVDTALAGVARAFTATPPGAPRRVVLVTDGLSRQDLSRERLRGVAYQTGAIVHFGILGGGLPRLSRADDHVWASALRPTGGLVWHATANEGNEPMSRTVFEEWARPKRLDHVRLYSPDLPVGMEMELPQTLDEGEGHERLFLAERAASSLRIEGDLWARATQVTFLSDPSQKKMRAAAVFGSPLLNELTEEEMMPLAMLGGAVSPVTSYLAIEPGVRPSTEGLEWGVGDGLVLHGVGTVRMGATSASGSMPPLDRTAFLQDALGTAWKRCGGAGAPASVTLETTRAEVVKVETGGVATPMLATCLSEAAWSLDLPMQFTDDWTVWSVDV